MSIDALQAARESLMGLAAGLQERGGEVRWTPDPQRARITAHNPGARGALTVAMMVQLADAVAAIYADPPALVLLEGTEGAFCSGGHLGEVRGGLGASGVARTLASAMTVVLDALERAPCLVVGWVDGPAVGGGWELATSVDLLWIGPRARFAFRQPALGVAAGWGGVPRLVRRVGRQRAMAWLSSAAELDPEAALASGLADALLSGEEALSDAMAPMRAIPAAALRAVKLQVDGAARGLDVDVQVDAFASVWGGAAHLLAMGIAPEES